MSVISTSEFTFGYFTLPAASAAGWPGWCLDRKSVGSVRSRPMVTTRASSVRSISLWKVGILRRYGSAPGDFAVESALAMFSAITRMRPACARNPEAAIESDLRKSMPQLLALAERGLHETQAA